jgi:hypothetical protein
MDTSPETFAKALDKARSALPTKRTSYSNQDFDIAQQIASELTEEDRVNGIPGAPRHGYSAANYALAESALRTWRLS